MKAPSKQRTLIGLLYDNSSRSFSSSEIQLLVRIQSHLSVSKTITNLRRAGAKVLTISGYGETRYQIAPSQADI
ncbi:hypothetical protein VP199E371_P0030 [Vibrio phage 199E37-1]|nr:hypothetical protein VP199E371_P0030 [Vibrio phage 199E37-1]